MPNVAKPSLSQMLMDRIKREGDRVREAVMGRSSKNAAAEPVRDPNGVNEAPTAAAEVDP